MLYSCTSVVNDDIGLFVVIEDKRRVKDVYVLNSDSEYILIDLNVIYTVASYNYLIKLDDDGISVYKEELQLVKNNL